LSSLLFRSSCQNLEGLDGSLALRWQIRILVMLLYPFDQHIQKNPDNYRHANGREYRCCIALVFSNPFFVFLEGNAAALHENLQVPLVRQLRRGNAADFRRNPLKPIQAAALVFCSANLHLTMRSFLCAFQHMQSVAQIDCKYRPGNLLAAVSSALREWFHFASGPVQGFR
jgi:hypothetical protein